MNKNLLQGVERERDSEKSESKRVSVKLNIVLTMVLMTMLKMLLFFFIRILSYLPIAHSVCSFIHTHIFLSLSLSLSISLLFRFAANSSFHVSKWQRCYCVYVLSEQLHIQENKCAT